MNKIHKIIWSKVRHCYVVVSEITKRDGKSVGGFFTGRKRNLTLALLTFLSLSSVISFPVYADTIGTYHAGDLKYDKDRGNKASWDNNHTVTDEDYGTIGLKDNVGAPRIKYLMGLISGDDVAGNKAGLLQELKHRTAIGNKFRVFGFGATAYGYGTNAVGEGSLAVGHAATTNGNEGTAIGSYAKVLKGQGTVVGANSWANDQAVALGADVRAQGYASISIGGDDADPNAFTGSKFSDKLPEKTIKEIYKDMIKDNPDWFKNKYMLDSTGNDRRVWSPNYAAGEASIAIGSRTVALGDASTSIGVLAMALADRSTALGVRSLVSSGAKGGMALGEESRVMSKDGLAVGNKTYSSGDGSLAYGYDAKALGANSIAIGHNVGANAMLNHEAQVTMANVLLYNGEGKIKPTGTSFDTTQDRINYLERIMDRYDKKNKQWVDDEGSVLRQWKDGNNGPYKTEYRKKQAQTGPKQWSDNAIAIGRRTYAIGDNSLVLGSLSLGAGNNSLNVGHFTYTKGENSAAIGMESAAIADNSMAIGVRSFANLTNSIAVGVGSKTDYTKEDLEQDGWAPRNAITFPSSTQVGVVSVGKIGSERRISNVASGYRDTDAVNVSQLRSLEERFSSNLPEDSDLNPFSYLAVDKMHGDVTKVIPLQKKEMNYRKYVNYRIKQIELQVREKNKEKVDETFKDRIQNVITNLEKGDNKTGIDASGLKGKNVDTILNELKAKYPGLDISDTNDVINKLNEWKKEKLKDSLKKALTEKEQGFLDGTNYLNDGAKGKDAIAVGYKAQSLADNSIAIGKESHVEKGAQGGIALGASSSATRAGGQRAYDFDNDRVFADDNAAGRGQGGIHANKSDTGALSIGSANYTRQITNVAGGSEDTDAVNVAQLKQVNNKINGVDTKINSVDTKVNNVNTKVEGNIGFNIEGNSGGQPWVAAGTKDSQKGKISLKIRGGDNDSNINVDLGRSTNDGFDTIEAKINLKHNLGNLESATFTKTEKGVTTTSVINDKGLTIGSGNTAVALTKDGLNMGSHQIHGVAEGKADTDAVNVAQVNKAIQAKADELKKKEIKAAQDTANTANSNATEAKSTANTAKSTADDAKSAADKVSKDLLSYKTEVKTELNNKANTGLDNLTQSGKTVVKNLAKEQIDATVTETFVTGKVKKGSVTSTTLTVTGDGKVVGADLTLEIKDKAISKGKLSDELVKEIEGKATKDEVANKAEKTYVDNQLNTKVNTSDFTTYKGEVTTALGKKADTETVNQQLATKVNTSDFDTYKGKVTADLAGKADADGGNITAPGQWAGKLGTGTVAENDTNLVTGGKVYAAIKDKANTSLDNLTEQGKTKVKDLAGEKITETVTNTFVTDKVTKGSIKSDTLDVTGDGKAIGSDLTINIKDGSITKAKLNNDLKTEIEGKATKDEVANKAEKTYVDNQLNTKVNTSDFTTYKGEVTTALGKKADTETVNQQLATKVNTSDFDTYKGKVTTDLAGKADADGGNITAPGQWAEKLGTGEVAENNANLVTGGKVFAAIKDKADKSELTNKADTSLNNITGDGKTVIKNLAKGAVKVADGTNTTVTTEDGKDGSKTYKVNVSDADIKKAVASDLDNKADKNTVTADLAKKADKDASNIGDTERTAWANKLGTGTISDNDANLVTGGTVKAALDKKVDTSTYTEGMAKKADVDGGNITAPGKWAEKLGTGVIADKDTNLVTGGKVYAAIKDKADKSELTNKAETSLNNITEAGKTVIKDLAKGAVKVADGTNTTVTTEDGKDGSKTYKVNVSDADIKKAVASDLDNKADKNTVTADLAKKADKDASNIGDTERTAWANKLGTGTISDNDANLVTGGTVKAALDKKVDTSTYTEGMAKKADVDGGNITAPGKWAEKLGTGTVAANDTNLVTGKTVYDFVNSIKIKSDNNATAITKLQTGFTIKDEGTGTSNVTLGGTAAPTITFKAATAKTDGATSSLVASVDADKNVTYTLNTKKLKEDLGITGKGVGSMSSWKIQATGGTATNVADGETVEFGKVENQGLTVTQTGKTIKYGIDIDKVIENINSSTTKKITNVDGDNIDLSKNTYITNITKPGGLLDNKANKDASNIGDTERTAWATKLGTGEVVENNGNLVTGGKVFAAIKDKADKSELTNKADTSLNTITEAGKTVIKNLAKGAVKVAAGTNTTVTTEDGTDGSKTYKVNVSDADIKKAVESDLNNKADKDTVTADLAGKADVNGGNITAPGKWAEKLGTGTIAANDTNLVTGGKVFDAIKDKADKSELTSKANTSLDNISDDGKTVIKNLAKGAVKVADGTNTTVTTEDGTDGSKTYKVNVSDVAIKTAVASDLNNKADKDATNIDDAAKAKWAGKLGTGTIADNDTNLVTGKTVYDFVNPIKIKSDNNATAITKLQTGFTIKDEGTGTSNVTLGGTAAPTITFKAATAKTDGATSSFVASVDADKNVTYTLNTTKLKEELGITGKGVGTMSSWKIQATGGTATNVADGEIVEFGTEENQGLTVTQTGKTIKYGINTDTVIDNINNSTMKKITNVDGDKIDLSKNTYITNITKTGGLLDNKANKDATNIDSSVWLTKLGLTDAMHGFKVKAGTGAEQEIKNGNTVTFDVEAGKGLTVTRDKNTIKYGIEGSQIDLTSNTAITNINNTLSSGFKVKAGNTEETVGLGNNKPETVEFKAVSENNSLTVGITKDDTTHTKTITYKLADDLTFGKAGENGKDGTLGVNGKDGSSVTINGKDGSIGLNGTNGQNGLSIRGEKGTEGKPGVDGTTTIKRIVITDPDGKNPHSVATLDDGLKFKGDIGDVAPIKLNNQVNIVGGETVAANLSDGNIGVDTTKEGNNAKLTVKLAKNLKNLESATFTKTEKGVTTTSVINDNGLTIGNNTDTKNVSLTKDGLNMAEQEITNVKDGTKVTSAATVGQINKAKEDLKTEIDKKADKDAGNIGDAERTAWATKLGTGKVEADNANLVTGKTVYDFVNPIKAQTETNKKDIATLQEGFTIQDETTPKAGTKVIKAKDTITFKSGANLTSKVGEDGSVTYGLNSALTNMNSITFAAPTAPAGGTSKALTINGTAGTITGLTNTTWDGKTIVTGRAATEDQLKALSETVNGNASSSTDYQLVKAGTTETKDGTEAYKADKDGNIDLLVQDKKHSGSIKKITISDVASKSSLDALKEEMKKNIQVGGKGADGADGVDGTIGVNGKDGKPGIGINGKDGGSITIHGTNGADGQDGQNGLTIRGVDGKKGEKGEKGIDGKDVNRIVTVDSNGTKHQLATLDDGLKFAGNSGNFYSKLNETVEIVGGVTIGEHEKAEDKLTDENIGVVAKKEEGKNGKLDIKLAKNLKNLSSATFTKTVENNGKKETTSTVINDSGTTVTDKDGNTNQTTAGGTVIQTKDGKEKVEIKKDGITITDVGDSTPAHPGKTISLTKDGFDNGGNKITNIADGMSDNDAATVGQVNAAKKEAMNTLTKGFDVKAGNVTGTVSLKADAKPTIEFLSSGSGLSVDLMTDAITHTQKITYRLSDTPVFGEKAVPGEGGKPGKDGKVEVIGKDGSAVVINGKDGSIGLNGTNGQNGLSVRGEKGTEVKPGVDGTTIVKRIVVTDSDGNNPHSVATLDDGLKFEGDGGSAVVKKLNESMKISGGVTDKAKLTDDNIGVIAENGQLNVKLAKTLTELTSVSSDKFVSGNTNIDTNGITIGKDTDVNKNVSLTKDGLNMGGKKINNFESGKVEKGNTEAVTGGAVSEALEKVKTEGSKALEEYKTSNDIAVKEAKAEAKKHTTIEAGDHLSIKEETDKNGGKKYTITGPSITSEDGSVTVEDNTDKGKNIGYKLSVNTEKIAEKIGKTEIESGDTNTAEVTSTKDAKTNKTTYKVNVKDMHVESGKISYDEGEGTLTLKYKDGNKVEVKGIQNTYTERGEYDEKRKKIIFKRNDGNTFNVDMSKLVNGMNFGIAKLDNKINRVGSGAAALAALKPLEFDPEDKWDVAVGYGNYMGANSLALGAFYRPNENTMFSLGGSFGDGENIINVGLSMKVGKGIQRFISKAEMANRIVEQDAEIAQLKAKDAQREAEIKALREKDEQRELQMKEILKKLNMA